MEVIQEEIQSAFKVLNDMVFSEEKELLEWVVASEHELTPESLSSNFASSLKERKSHAATESKEFVKTLQYDNCRVSLENIANVMEIKGSLRKQDSSNKENLSHFEHNFNSSTHITHNRGTSCIVNGLFTGKDYFGF